MKKKFSRFLIWAPAYLFIFLIGAFMIYAVFASTDSHTYEISHKDGTNTTYHAQRATIDGGTVIFYNPNGAHTRMVIDLKSGDQIKSKNGGVIDDTRSDSGDFIAPIIVTR